LGEERFSVVANEHDTKVMRKVNAQSNPREDGLPRKG
jgi:hypothetical protein